MRVFELITFTVVVWVHKTDATIHDGRLRRDGIADASD
jgi:hypothetical protein